MTFRNGITTRRNLTEDEVKERMSNYFTDEEIRDAIKGSKEIDSWTDGNVALIRTGLNIDPRFVIVANSNFPKMIEP